MDIAAADLAPDRIYKILVSTVMPRPIALITTIGEDGVVNAAPFSFFNLMGGDPPILAVAPGDRPAFRCGCASVSSPSPFCLVHTGLSKGRTAYYWPWVQGRL